MSMQPKLRLNDGKSIPQLGLGVWQASEEEAARAVEAALKSGYRHVDTAAVYKNETGVGEGLRAAGLPREEVFVTTKVWNEDQGHDATLKACEASLKRLGLDHVDLYLIHWPSPQRGLYVETWKALIKLREEGRVRSIGVSNFAPEHLDKIIAETGVVPVLNQIELHPRFQQAEMRTLHRTRGILTECWSPLGQGKLLDDPQIGKIAEKYGKTPAQVIIRWHLQNGSVVIPKSVTPSRIAQNFDVFDFELEIADISAIGALDAAEGRIGPDPLTADF
ncbi:aldo/keto reductase [Thioclava sp. BHET1]|nr:aldo/keto reductase [Thioclava sp. BHET1]